MFTPEQLAAIDARLGGVVSKIIEAAVKEAEEVKLLIKGLPNISQADMDVIFNKIDGMIPAAVAAVDKISNDASGNTGDTGGGGTPQP